MQDDLAREWLRAGGWGGGGYSVLGLGRCYKVIERHPLAGSVGQLRSRLRAVIASEQPASAKDAALAALSQISGLVEDDRGYADVDPPRSELLAACDSARWLVEEAAAFMIAARRATIDPIGWGGPDSGH